MRKFTSLLLTLTLALSVFGLSGCSDKKQPARSEWSAGFSSCEIDIPENSSSPIYIAGYKNGAEITGVLDKQRANAVWLQSADGNGILLVSVDCIALSGDTVKEITASLSGFIKQTGCVSVNIFSTHTHAGADTLGLWGEIGCDGKNPEFMENLKSAVIKASKQAYKAKKSGTLTYGSCDTKNLQSDSRYPYVFSKTMHQFRFLPNGEKSGIRIIVYSAHAEALGSENTKISRDYPGVMSDKIKAECGDDTLFINGAIGGLIATARQASPAKSAEENMRLTGERLANCALNISEQSPLSPTLKAYNKEFKTPLDNSLFMYYRFLGILGNECVAGKSDTGYSVKTSISLLNIGGKNILCLPCEIFPELVTGESLKADDPKPLRQIAEENGVKDLIVAGLCNDEIGYVVTPSDFLVDSKLPFIKEAPDLKGEAHYEETNSVGKHAAESIADAFSSLLKSR